MVKKGCAVMLLTNRDNQMANRIAARLTSKKQALQANLLRKKVQKLQNHVMTLEERLECARPAVEIPILHFEPEPFEVIGEIRAFVQQDDDSFVATFADANISASGETQNDAVMNLKDIMAALFVRLGKEEGKLGKGPARQLAVLRAVLRRKT